MNWLNKGRQRHNTLLRNPARSSVPGPWLQRLSPFRGIRLFTRRGSKNSYEANVLVPLQDGRFLPADDKYLRDCILQPATCKSWPAINP